MEIPGKTVLITGASSGIGYSLTKLFAAEKCNLALLSRRKEILDGVASELKNTGSNFLTLKCDVTNRLEVLNATENIIREFGDIDIAILNSGIGGREKVNNFNSSIAEDIFGVNVLGMIYCIEALLPGFIEKESGLIVGVSSLADGRGFPANGLYCASKAAATKLLESFRVELKEYNVKVLTVKPGFVKTPMTAKNKFKMPFLMDADKAARIILNGIKREKRIIQFPVPTVLGAKLLRVMPDFLFEFIATRVEN